MGRWHFEVARSLGARIVAIVDSDQKAAQLLGRRAPHARLLSQSASLETHLAVEVAHVCTPAATHASIALDLLERGISALVEKPLADDAATTRRILETAQRTGAQICPVHQYAFQDAIERARAALANLGTVHRIEFNICSAGASDGVMTPANLISEILPHPISILQRFFPDMPVNHLAWSILNANPGEFLASSQYRETLISIYISANARPTRMTTQLQCASGSIEIDGYHGYAIVLPGAVSRAAKISAPFSRSLGHLTAAAKNLAGRSLRGEAAYPGLKELTRQFYESVARKDRSLAPISIDAILAGAEARDDMRREPPLGRQADVAP